jgi:trehalose-6-phosphate synthase
MRRRRWRRSRWPAGRGAAQRGLVGEFEGCHGGPGDGGEDVVSQVGVAARMRRLQQRHPVPAVPRRDRHSGFNSQWWETYVEVNERFAAVAAACAADNATVWVHDYQLQLVPSGLRRRRPDVRIGPFNHVPFPGYEIFAQLPWRRQLVQGMLGADLIGFQRCRGRNQLPESLQAGGSEFKGPRGCPGVHALSAPNADSTGGDRAPGGRRDVRVGLFPISIEFTPFDSQN